MEQTLTELAAEYSDCLRLWNAAYEEHAKEAGLSYTSLQILNVIARIPGCTQKMLCEQCYLPKQTINTVITSFLKKGWIELVEMPEDRRNKKILLTEKGDEVCGRILKPVRESELSALGDMTQEERDELIRLTRKYVTACRDELSKR